jgi:hypothetical protein
MAVLMKRSNWLWSADVMVEVSMIGNQEEHNDCHHTRIVTNRCFFGSRPDHRRAVKS